MILKKQLQAITFGTILLASFGCTSATPTGKDTMNSETTCELTPLKRSQEILKAVLADISNTYSHVGGGITGIKLAATDVYVVSIAQEERIDQITYTVSVDEKCRVKMINKEVGAISPWEQ